GVLNGIVDIANRIELGQIRAGLVVSCETAREINDLTIDALLRERSMDLFKSTLAALTGGSGAVAVLLTDGSFHPDGRRGSPGAPPPAPPRPSALSRWGPPAATAPLPGLISYARQIACTDSVGILKFGVDLGLRSWKCFLSRLGWVNEMVDKVI